MESAQGVDSLKKDTGYGCGIQGYTAPQLRSATLRFGGAISGASGGRYLQGLGAVPTDDFGTDLRGDGRLFGRDDARGRADRNG